QEGTQRLGHGERCGLRDRVCGYDRQWGQGRHRQVVDDGPPRTSQQWQECPGHAVRAEQVDGEDALECGAIAEVIAKRQAGIVDEEIERLDLLDGSLNLRRVRHVQRQRRDAPVRVGQGLARTRIYPLRTSPEGFVDQCTPDTAIRAGDENCSVCDFHTRSHLLLVVANPRSCRRSGSRPFPSSRPPGITATLFFRSMSLTSRFMMWRRRRPSKIIAAISFRRDGLWRVHDRSRTAGETSPAERPMLAVVAMSPGATGSKEEMPWPSKRSCCAIPGPVPHSPFSAR